VRPVFPYSARPSVASFPPAALPAFTGTMSRSDSLLLFCLPPFGRLWGILSVSLLLTTLSCSSESSGRVSRVAVLSRCHACHGLRPRGSEHHLALHGGARVDFRAF
jgi:hypothetical protein